MSMNVGSENSSGDPDVIVDVNTTPLIDVMLVLLIMLIITIPIQTHAVKLDLPQGNPPPPLTPPTVVTIDVDFDGQIAWNGQPMTNEADLVSHFQSAAALPDQPEIHLRPNKLANYKYVAHVLADAQRLGMTKLGIVGNEQFIGQD
ncbi:biopolymer transporter ExbD [Lichenicola cladoniae]|uniref:Biopolymer transporter ExbD n=1 Tax=Lichenicola cladoniae TaxID=1484109 RepID=A0A6M8HFK3_9PROT|nr:biopolymer transporter ExbD [Lichenicola cladoniae]NPD69249.1 biopolymer transporter ExbD [Acetobacteraceae bacterium]QKE89070.1 biopolymer transporter ExbD [Lichenicola cladoniae]